MRITGGRTDTQAEVWRLYIRMLAVTDGYELQEVWNLHLLIITPINLCPQICIKDPLQTIKITLTGLNKCFPNFFTGRSFLGSKNNNGS
jgi:hypothetical protein